MSSAIQSLKIAYNDQPFWKKLFFPKLLARILESDPATQQTIDLDYLIQWSQSLPFWQRWFWFPNTLPDSAMARADHQVTTEFAIVSLVIGKTHWIFKFLFDCLTDFLRQPEIELCEMLHANNLLTENIALPILRRHEDDIDQVTSGSSYVTFNDPETEFALHDDLVIPALIALLKSPSDTIKQHAAHVLKILAEISPEYQLAIRESHGIPELIALLQSSSDEIKKQASGALWHLAEHCPGNQLAILEGGGIRLLIALLQFPSATCMYNAVGALSVLALNCPENQSAIRESQGIPELIALLKSGSDEIKKQVSVVLCSLAENCPENQSAIREGGGIRPLIALLKSPFDMCIRNAVAALYALVGNCPENQIAIREAGGIPDLITLLQSHSKPIKRIAAHTLMELAFNSPENQSAIREGGGIPALIALLSSHSDTIKECVVAALWHLAVDCHENQLVIRESHGISTLMALLSSHSDAIMNQGAKADLSQVNKVSKYWQFPVLVGYVMSEDDVSKALCTSLDKLEALYVGRLLGTLVDNRKWGVLERICLQVPKNTIAKFQQYTGMHLNVYLKTNVNFPAPPENLLRLLDKILAVDTSCLTYLPSRLPENKVLLEKLAIECSEKLNIKHDDFWRLLIDYEKQRSGNPDIFDETEPGYRAGLTNAWHHMLSMQHQPLTLDSLIRLHDAAVIYPSTGDLFGRVFSKCYRPFNLGIGLIFGNPDNYSHPEYEEANDDAVAENKMLSNWLVHYSCSPTGESRVGGQFQCYQDVINKTDRILKDYHDSIHLPNADETQKLKAIAWLCKQLKMFHIFSDGNQRTISFLLLNQELRRNGMNLCILPDPVCFDGYLSVEDLVEEIQVGQQLAKIHLCLTIDQKTEEVKRHCSLLTEKEPDEKRLSLTLRVMYALLTQAAFDRLLNKQEIFQALEALLVHPSDKIKNYTISILNVLSDAPETKTLFDQTRSQSTSTMSLFFSSTPHATPSVSENQPLPARSYR